jgi:hypothetical protein
MSHGIPTYEIYTRIDRGKGTFVTDKLLFRNFICKELISLSLSLSLSGAR